MKSLITLNNKILCEPYLGGKGLKSEVKSGFATVQQKNNLVGLKVLANAHVKVSADKTLEIGAGSIVYFNEETLYTYPQYHSPIKNDVLDQPCILANFDHVIGVSLHG